LRLCVSAALAALAQPQLALMAANVSDAASDAALGGRDYQSLVMVNGLAWCLAGTELACGGAVCHAPTPTDEHLALACYAADDCNDDTGGNVLKVDVLDSSIVLKLEIEWCDLGFRSRQHSGPMT